LTRLLSDRARADSLIGRDRETARLVAGLDDAIAGRGRLFLISGEPGIGKTGLAEEIAKDAAERGMRVLWGRCWEGRGAPAYWPWIQILRALIAYPDQTQFRSPLVTQEISRLIPELSSESSRPFQDDPDEERFRLFDCVATMLREIARSQPLFLVFDDLHDADQTSLEMLKFVARGLSIAHVFVIGTFRDGANMQSPTLASLIGDLMHEGYHLPLRGLNEAEVAAFLEDRAGLAASEKLVRALRQATAGNPLLLDGVARMLLAEGKLAHPETISAADLTVPDGVRGVINSQINCLSKQAQSILAIASATGNEFEVGLLQGVAGISEKEVLDLLDETVAARITSPLSGSRTRHRFAHGLIRTATYDAIGTSQRIVLHRQIGEKLEELYGSDPNAHLAELAHHFVEAIPLLDARKAIDYSIRAGRAAYEVFAFEDAAFHWRAALAVMRDSDPQRAWLLERLGGPHLYGFEKSGIDYLKKALRIYERFGKTESAAKVQLNLGHMLRGANDLSLRDYTLARTYLRKAESGLSASRNPRLQASLYMGLSDVAWELASADEGFAASARAMEICERLGDELLWVGAATAHACSLNSSGRHAEGFSLLAQAWQKADRLDNAAAASIAASQICYHHALLWNPTEGEGWARRELSRARLAQAPGLRKDLIHCLSHLYLCTGKALETRRLATQAECLLVEAVVTFYYSDWEEAERVFCRDLEVQGQGTGRPVQEFFAMLWLARLHRASDRLSEADVLLKRALAIIDGQILHLEIDARSELALLYGENADSKKAQPHLARIREIVASGENWAGLEGHVKRAEGAVAASEQRFEEARQQFESAVEIARRYRVPWDEAEGFFCWGCANMSMEQYETAVEKFDSAVEIYRHIGAGKRWIDRACSMRSKAKAGATRIKPPQVDATFHRDGDFWSVGIGTATGNIKDLRGMHYIFYLLQHPGERIHVRELAQIEAGIEGATRARSGGLVEKEFGETPSGTHDLGDAGPVLDSQALSAYKCRYDELGSELQEAETFNDVGRVARLRAERESLGLQLRSALTVHGRVRTAGAHGERARSAVCKSIRFSLKRIAKFDPALGRFLNESVHTGYECAYLPKNPFTWVF
jgi:tetratricopeptide (TPR) repeat protein